MAKFYGVAHVHSTYSFDGSLKIGELATFFCNKGVHVVLLSEHVESLDPEKVSRLATDCARLSTASLLLIPGIEIDDLNALFYDVWDVKPWRDCEDLAKQLADAGALVVVSHPVKVRSELPRITAATVEGVEIWNTRHDGKMAPARSILEFWRNLRQHLNRPLLPLCGIDFHRPHDFTPLMFELDCERLEREVVMQAIRAGQYRIVRKGKPVPINFETGELVLHYRAYAGLYRLTYRAIYAIHRAFKRFGFRVPPRLRSLLRPLF